MCWFGVVVNASESKINTPENSSDINDDPYFLRKNIPEELTRPLPNVIDSNA